MQDHGLSAAQATVWSSKKPRSFVTLSSSLIRSRKPGMRKRVIKILCAAKEEATTHGPTSSIPQKLLDLPEIQQTTTTTPEMEREIWDMFMRAEANEEKALDASQEGVATTTAVLEPPGKKVGKFEGNKYLFCTEGTGKVSVYAFFPNLSYPKQHDQDCIVAE